MYSFILIISFPSATELRYVQLTVSNLSSIPLRVLDVLALEIALCVVFIANLWSSALVVIL